MDGYFLIARNRKDNSFKVLKLQESWFLGKKRGRDSVFTRRNDLEAIDLVTTKFTSEKQMAERLASNGYISDSDVDIFIASKRNKDGKSYVRFDEVLYNPSKDNYISALRRLAYVSLQTDFRVAKDELAEIYDELISTAYFADDFFDMLLDGKTNVPRRFAEQLGNIRKADEIPYDLKNSLSLEENDYPTVRNIVEALNRLTSLELSSREDRYVKNLSFIERNLSDRMAIIEELASQLDENYVEGQISIFSLDKKKREAAKEVVTEEQIIPEKIVIPRKGVTDAEKKKAVYRILRGIPKKAFYVDEQGVFKVNYSLFKHPLLDEEKRKLDTYLTGNLPKFFAEYVVNYTNFCEAQRHCVGSELCELQSDVDYSARKINNRFRSSKTLNMAYEWCMLYDGCTKREAAYEASGITVSDAADNAKVYGKKV